MLGVNWPQKGYRKTTVTGRPTGNAGTNVQSGAVTQTLSATFTTLESSLPFDIYWINITISDTCLAATQTDALLNLYIGAGGSEKLWISGLLAGWSAANGNGSVVPKIYQFPLYLPAGTRISAKSQALETSKNVRVWLEYSSNHNKGGWCGTGIETVGVNTATSQGVSVTPGAGAEGTYTDIGASTKKYAYILPMLQGQMSDTTTSAAYYMADIGAGGISITGLEQFMFVSSSGETVSQALGLGGYCDIAPGTTVQLRLQNGGSAVKPIDAALYGVY